MIPPMPSVSSSSSATVRVDKATSEFLIGPDWTMNIDICDTINSNHMLAKDVVKAVKKRLQHKNPKVQLLALTLLEMMVKNCGDYVHFQIAERNILQEMVKIVKKKTDMNLRDKILTLIGSWHEAFGGSAGRYPQYYMAYEELRRLGVQFPRGPPDAAPILTPPLTHPISGHPRQAFGFPNSSSTRVGGVMPDGNLSLSSINSMQDVANLLNDMLQAVDPSNPLVVNDELIIYLVEQCRANQRNLMQLLTTTRDEGLLGHGLELNDSLQGVLAKHDAIAFGSPLPPQSANVKPGEIEKHNSSLKPVEAVITNAKSCDPSAPVRPTHRGPIEEKEEEEDDFAQLARRHSKVQLDASHGTSVTNSNDLTVSKTSNDVATLETPQRPGTSTALVPTNTATPVGTKDQDIIDLLSLTLSVDTTTEQTYQTPPDRHEPSTETSSSSDPYSGHHGSSFNTYIAPWAQPVAEAQPRVESQPEHAHQPQPQVQHQSLHVTQSALQPPQPKPQYPQFSSGYPPPPWAATPGYLSSQALVSRPSNTYSTPRPASSLPTRPLQHVSINGETRVGPNPTPAAANAGQKTFIPSYRLFEDLDVFGNADGRHKGASTSMGGRK